MTNTSLWSLNSNIRKGSFVSILIWTLAKVDSSIQGQLRYNINRTFDQIGNGSLSSPTNFFTCGSYRNNCLKRTFNFLLSFAIDFLCFCTKNPISKARNGIARIANKLTNRLSKLKRIDKRFVKLFLLSGFLFSSSALLFSFFTFTLFLFLFLFSFS